MKKIFALFLCVFVLFSCNNETEYTKLKKSFYSNLFIESIINDKDILDFFNKNYIKITNIDTFNITNNYNDYNIDIVTFETNYDKLNVTYTDGKKVTGKEYLYHGYLLDNNNNIISNHPLIVYNNKIDSIKFSSFGEHYFNEYFIDSISNRVNYIIDNIKNKEKQNYELQKCYDILNTIILSYCMYTPDEYNNYFKDKYNITFDDLFKQYKIREDIFEIKSKNDFYNIRVIYNIFENKYIFDNKVINLNKEYIPLSEELLEKIHSEMKFITTMKFINILN